MKDNMHVCDKCGHMSELNIIEPIRHAFTEFMISRFRIPKKAIPAYWDIFFKSLEWRLKDLIK